MVYECERRLHINASADAVWHWMADVRRLLCLNIFHTAVDYPEPVTRAGLCVPIQHNVCWLYRQTRMAHIRTYRRYFVARNTASTAFHTVNRSLLCRSMRTPV